MSIAEVAERGWLFNNVYQLDDGSWRVNLRKLKGDEGDWFTEWAEGATFDEAVEECLSRTNDAEFFETRKVTYSIDKSQPKSLLEAIGLKPKGHPVMTEPLKRRI